MNNMIFSRESRKSREDCIAKGSQLTIRLKTLGEADKRGRSDAPFARFARFA